MNRLAISSAMALGTVYRRSLVEGNRRINSAQVLAIRLPENQIALGKYHPRICRPDEEDPAEKIQRLEAVLFLAKEPLTSRKLSQYANLADGTEARTLIRRLNRNLDSLGRAFRIEEVAGGFQFVSRSKFSPWLRRLEHVPRATRLSAPAMETLAVVSYRQPVIRADIEAVRGVSCGEILNQLLNRDLVRISGRSEELGRPYMYSTTKNFLRLFGLRNLEELPRNDYLTGSGVADSNESKSDEQVDFPNALSKREVEEEHGVSILVEPNTGTAKQEDEKLTPAIANDGHDLRMDDEDYDYEEEDEEADDDDEYDVEEEEVEDDDLEDDDEYEYEDADDDDVEDDEDELEEDEEYEYEEDEEADDDDELEDDDDLDGDDDELEDEDDEWEEVDGDEEESEDDDEDWEDDDWEDDEEWDDE